MKRDSIRNWIKTELPGEGGWWVEDSEKNFISASDRMLDAGMEEDEVKDILIDLYTAVSSEFGGIIQIIRDNYNGEKEGIIHLLLFRLAWVS